MLTYLEVAFVLVVEIAGGHMVAAVPLNVEQSSVVGLVFHNLLLRQLLAAAVVETSI